MDPLPHDLNKLCTINYNNLSETIDFLYKHLIGFSIKLTNLTNDFQSLSDLKQCLTEFQIQKEKQRQDFEDMQKSFQNFANKFIDIDENINKTNERINGLEDKINILEKDAANKDIFNKLQEDFINMHMGFADQKEKLATYLSEMETNKAALNDVQNKCKELEKTDEDLSNRISETEKNLTKAIETETNLRKNETEELKRSILNVNTNLAKGLAKIEKDEVAINNVLNSHSDNIDKLFTNLGILESKTEVPKIEHVFVRDENQIQKELQNDIQKEFQSEKPKVEETNENKEETKTEQQIENTGENFQTEIKNYDSQGNPIIINEANYNILNQSSNPNQLVTEKSKRSSKNYSNEIYELSIKLENLEDKHKREVDALSKEIEELKVMARKDSLLEENLNFEEKEENKKEETNRPLTVTDNQEEDIKIQKEEEIPNQKESKRQSLKSLNISIDTKGDNFKESILESLNKLASTVNKKAYKDDVDRENANKEKQIIELGKKLNEELAEMDHKISSIKSMLEIAKGDGDNALNMDAITEVISTNMKDFLYSKKGKEILEGIMNGANLYMNSCFKELNSETKKSISILESRVGTIAEKVEFIEKDISENKPRIDDAEASLKKLKFNLDMIIKTIEGEGSEGQISDVSIPIREQLSNLYSKSNQVFGETLRLDKKIDNINSNVLMVIQRDLKAESQKILIEFKSDLKNSISKIEAQLKGKVDRLGLMEFGQKIDNKVSTQMKKKLGRDELTKNNVYINRKIDSLETRISKSLVDTLIDLQMEEAPLLVKKNMVGGSPSNWQERCASCNQVLPQYMQGKYVQGNTPNVQMSMQLQSPSCLPEKYKLSPISAKGKRNITVNESYKESEIIKETKRESYDEKDILPSINPINQN
ncbi:MAG: hypothetical protein MJ252_19320 [archaeon]|nr:hypothetical protein [archaeon]